MLLFIYWRLHLSFPFVALRVLYPRRGYWNVVSGILCVETSFAVRTYIGCARIVGHSAVVVSGWSTMTLRMLCGGFSMKNWGRF